MNAKFKTEKIKHVKLKQKIYTQRKTGKSLWERPQRLVVGGHRQAVAVAKVKVNQLCARLE